MVLVDFVVVYEEALAVQDEEALAAGGLERVVVHVVADVVGALDYDVALQGAGDVVFLHKGG